MDIALRLLCTTIGSTADFISIQCIYKSQSTFDDSIMQSDMTNETTEQIDLQLSSTQEVSKTVHWQHPGHILSPNVEDEQDHQNAIPVCYSWMWRLERPLVLILGDLVPFDLWYVFLRHTRRGYQTSIRDIDLHCLMANDFFRSTSKTHWHIIPKELLARISTLTTPTLQTSFVE